jgi:hypothetical protein
MSKTYFAGEKYLNPESYDFTVHDFGENQSAYTGFEWDNTRLARSSPTFAPRQDQKGYNNWDIFGGPHSSGFNAVLCDGAVLNVNYQIDGEIHRRFGNRLDGLPVDISSI